MEEKDALLKNSTAIKEVFIMDELQKYMDLSKNPPIWVEPVRLRLQEKEDWKRKVKQTIEELRAIHYKGQNSFNAPDCFMHAGAYIALGELLDRLNL